MELVSVFAAAGNAPLYEVTREEARAMKEEGTHFFINHGKSLRAISAADDGLTEIETLLNWRPPGRREKDSVLNRGRVGQFTIGYPIPYAFEGHLRSPRVSVVNAGDPLHAKQ